MPKKPENAAAVGTTAIPATVAPAVEYVNGSGVPPLDEIWLHRGKSHVLGMKKATRRWLGASTT